MKGIGNWKVGIFIFPFFIFLVMCKCISSISVILLKIDQKERRDLGT